MEPSGKGWPLSGTPALNDLIIFGLATMTLSISSVRAEETTAQSSYPLKSENAIPLGDFSVFREKIIEASPPSRGAFLLRLTASAMLRGMQSREERHPASL